MDNKDVATPKADEGYVEVSGSKIFYRSFEPVECRGAVICVHGGPGATHDYLLPLRKVTNWGYRAVFYDMSGCGKSQQVEASTFTIELCVEELEGLRRALRLGVIHLFGHSLGGAVALAYAMKHREALASLIVCSGFASTPQVAYAMGQLKSELPLGLQLALKRSEETGNYTDRNYRAAIRELVRRHYSRGLKGDEKEHNFTLEHMNRDLYRSGWGPNDFVITGTMKDWDITKSLNQLQVPCLITVGKYDEIPLALAENMHREIAGSKLVVFGSSSHLAMWEESERFLQTLVDFLLSVPRK